MPKWMLQPMTDEELYALYDNLPFVKVEESFTQFKEKWKKK